MRGPDNLERSLTMATRATSRTKASTSSVTRRSTNQSTSSGATRKKPLYAQSTQTSRATAAKNAAVKTIKKLDSFTPAGAVAKAYSDNINKKRTSSLGTSAARAEKTNAKKRK